MTRRRRFVAVRRGVVLALLHVFVRHVRRMIYDQGNGLEERMILIIKN